MRCIWETVLMKENVSKFIYPTLPYWKCYTLWMYVLDTQKNNIKRQNSTSTQPAKMCTYTFVFSKKWQNKVFEFIFTCLTEVAMISVSAKVWLDFKSSQILLIVIINI